MFRENSLLLFEVTSMKDAAAICSVVRSVYYDTVMGILSVISLRATIYVGINNKLLSHPLLFLFAL